MPAVPRVAWQCMWPSKTAWRVLVPVPWTPQLANTSPFPSHNLLEYLPDHPLPLQVALTLLSFRTARYHIQMLFSHVPPPTVLVPVREGLSPGSSVCYMMGWGSSRNCLLVKEWMKRDIRVSNGNGLTWGNRCAVISIAACAAPAPVTHISPVLQSPGGCWWMGLGTSRKEREVQKMTLPGLTTGSVAYKGSSPKGAGGKGWGVRNLPRGM